MRKVRVSIEIPWQLIPQYRRVVLHSILVHFPHSYSRSLIRLQRLRTFVYLHVSEYASCRSHNLHCFPRLAMIVLKSVFRLSVFTKPALACPQKGRLAGVCKRNSSVFLTKSSRSARNQPCAQSLLAWKHRIVTKVHDYRN